MTIDLVIEGVGLDSELGPLALGALQLSHEFFLLAVVGRAARLDGFRGPVREPQLRLQTGAHNLAVGELVLQPGVLVAQRLIDVAELVQARL